MARVLVVGGTGLAGREVVAEAVRRGLQVRVLSRRPPADGAAQPGVQYAQGDLTTGAGLADALAGVDVLVDTTDGKTGKAQAVLTDGARNLLAAAADAGVPRAVLLSIINVDRGPIAYYRAKAAQEKVYLKSPLQVQVVRATQFHNFSDLIFAPGARFGVIPVLAKARFQPIGLPDVATALVDAALDGGAGGGAGPITTVGGPEVLTAREFASRWKRARGSRALLVPVPLPGAAGQFFRKGLNLTGGPGAGTLTYDEWLAQAYPR